MASAHVGESLCLPIFVFPTHRNVMNQVALPCYGIGEAAMIVRLFIEGMNVPP